MINKLNNINLIIFLWYHAFYFVISYQCEYIIGFWWNTYLTRIACLHENTIHQIFL